jgi:hypothetical protein
MAEENTVRIYDNFFGIKEETKEIQLKDTEPLKLSEKVYSYITSKNPFEQGDRISLLIDKDLNEVVMATNVTKKPFKTKVPKPVEDSEKKDLGYVYLQGKWYATFEVLLNKIHELYISHHIKTSLVELDYESRFAVFKTKIDVFDNDGNLVKSYSAYGDSDKTNLNADMQKSFIRMAETRSIVRALRLATNIAETSVDELPSEQRK